MLAICSTFLKKVCCNEPLLNFRDILAGAYEVLIGEEHVATCEAPQPFGDLALMYNAPRAATIKAIEPCTL